VRQRHAARIGCALGVLLTVGWTVAVRAEPVTVGWKILLPDGKPAVGAKVLVRVVRKGRMEVKDTWVETGADGAFSADVEVEPGAWDEPDAGYGFLMIDMPGHALLAWDLPYGNMRKPSEVKLSPEFEITGQVVGPDGQPVPDADVAVLHLKPMSMDGAAGAWGLTVPRWKVDYPPLITKAGADGTFKLRGIVGDNAVPWAGVVTSAPGLVSYPSESAVQPGAAPLKLSLKPSLSVAGAVVHALTGQPVSGARVRPVAYSGDQAATRAFPQTDAQGHFEIAGLYPVERLCVEATYPDLAKAWVEVSAKESSKDVVLKLRPWATITGHLVDQDTGQALALAGVLVCVTWDPGQQEERTPFIAPGRERIQTDAEGKFTLRTAVGETKITASGQQYREVSPIIVGVPPEGADVTVPVRKQGR